MLLIFCKVKRKRKKRKKEKKRKVKKREKMRKREEYLVFWFFFSFLCSATQINKVGNFKLKSYQENDFLASVTKETLFFNLNGLIRIKIVVIAAIVVLK